MPHPFLLVLLDSQETQNGDVFVSLIHKRSKIPTVAIGCICLAMNVEFMYNIFNQ